MPEKSTKYYKDKLIELRKKWVEVSEMTGGEKKDNAEKELEKNIVQLMDDTGAIYLPVSVTTAERTIHRFVSIHQALQTASRVDIAEAAKKNYELTMSSVKESSKTNKVLVWAAILSMAAAWAAVIVNIVITSCKN